MSVSIDRLASAIKEAKERSKPRRFKQGVELIVKLRDIDVKKPENRINVSVPLPHPPMSKLAKVAVFATGDLALKAKEAGVDAVIDKDEIAKIASEKKEAKKIARSYDFFYAQPDMMPLIGRMLGRYLGPRGKMPEVLPPTANVKAMIERAKRSVRLRIRDQPLVMCRIGTEDQSEKELAENANEVLNALLRKFEPRNIERVYVKLTMGPPVEVPIRGK
ncbi:MAG: 50S ribosomal protein L1 [Thermoprotei archaeon]|nr:MAG: 50S ribosomal protein L1 [Thermoprotei archaeon]HDI31420.1 50S ribosomal protein L1 [Thermofilum sp.]